MTMRRLHVQLYLVMLATGFLCLLAVGVAFRVVRDRSGPPAQRLGHAAGLLAETRPDLEGAEAQAKLAALADAMAVDVVIGDDSGVLMSSPSPRPFPPLAHIKPGDRKSVV